MFEPRFRITGSIAAALMSIEADRQIVGRLPLSARLLDSLRRSARLLSTHLSTQIEGNRLTVEQVRAAVAGDGTFPGRERDEAEVRHYFAALESVEELGRTDAPLLERELRTIHGLVMTGKPKPTRYRDAQNIIRDARTGRTVYLPPESEDVPQLMADLVAWVNDTRTQRREPVPVIAALAHYQVATIHPYFDGNGRTARLLTNLLLHRGGYGLNGIYSLEEYYAEHLDRYYAALAVGPSHNYYFGRAEADLTPFLEYFCAGMADAFARVRQRAEESSRFAGSDRSMLLRELTPQQRQVLGLFLRTREAKSRDIAAFFQFPLRRASALCSLWVQDGFLVVGNPSTKGRTYRLADRFLRLLEPTKVERRRPRGGGA